MIKAIFMCGYGNSDFPKNIYDKKVDAAIRCGLRWRIDEELIDFIESLKCKEYTMEDLKKLSAITEPVVIHNNDGSDYYFPSENSPSGCCHFAILNIDNSRKWTVEEYDGSEYVKYLDSYIPVDKDAGFYMIANT